MKALNDPCSHVIFLLMIQTGASQEPLVVKNPLANAGDIRDTGLIPGSGRSSGGGHGNPLQYSCLENPMDRGGWWATVHGVAKSQTQLSKYLYSIITIPLLCLFFQTCFANTQILMIVFFFIIYFGRIHIM